MKSITSLEDLVAWQKARIVRKNVARMVTEFPKSERYQLRDQIIRSSRSIPANIAESFGRFHFKESAQYARQARGSLLETLEHLYCAFDEGFIDEDTFNQQKVDIQQCLKVLNGYIHYLSTASKSNNSITQ